MSTSYTERTSPSTSWDTTVRQITTAGEVIPVFPMIISAITTSDVSTAWTERTEPSTSYTTRTKP